MATDSMSAELRNINASLINRLSRELYPRTIEDMLAWSTYMWDHFGTYSQGIRRAVRYFLTSVDITGDKDLSYEAKQSYEDYLTSNFSLMTDLGTIGDDFVGWGNSVTTLHIPFNRSLVCKLCGTSRDIRQMHGNYSLTDKGEFSGTCEKCRRAVVYETRDLQKAEPKLKPVVSRWPVHYCDIAEHPISGRKRITLRTTQYEWLVRGVTARDPLFMEDTPMEFIRAVIQRRRMEFAQDKVYHMRYQPPAARLPVFRGWGIPPFLSEFEDVIMLLMLDRFNEMIVRERLMPMRIVSPPAPAAAGNVDMLLKNSMRDFVANAKTMYANYLRNPTGMNFFSMPLAIQDVGGDAKQLIPVELVEHFEHRVLNSMGIPSEFYSDSVANSAGPILGFRMFERFWQHKVNALNDWLNWLVQRHGQFLQWQKVQAALTPVAMYEAPEVVNVILQLNAAGKMPDSEMYRALGRNPRLIKKQLMAEAIENEEVQAQLAKERDKRAANTQALQEPPPGQAPQGAPGMPAQPGGMPPPAPGGGGGQPTATLEGMAETAQAMAQQIITLDPLSRRRELANLKHSDVYLYHQVKGYMDQMNQNAQTAGVQLMNSGQIPPQA